ncbi:MAG: hypothetical protein R3F17_10035 [Planctomycetota bacterium]
MGGPAFAELDAVVPGEVFTVVIYNTTGLAVSDVGGPGTLAITPMHCAAAGQEVDALEPNNSCVAAAPLVVGTHTGLTVQQGDPDYYKVWVPAMNRLQVQIPGSAVPMAVARILGDDCEPPYSVGMEFDNFSFEDREVMIQVGTASSVECAQYKLVVELLPTSCSGSGGSDDAFEPNESCSEAAPIQPGFWPGLFASNLDPDFYQVMMPPQSVLRYSVSSADPVTIEPDLDCAPITTTVPGYLFNPDSQPAPAILQVRATECAVYDLTLDVTTHLCMRPAFELSSGEYGPFLLDGTYLDIDPWSIQKLRINVYPGRTLDVQVDLPFGIGHLEILDMLTDTFPFGLIQASTGNPAHVTWTNNTNWPEMVGLNFAPVPGAAGPDPCQTAQLTVQGAGGLAPEPLAQDFCGGAAANSTGLPVDLFAWQPEGPSYLSIQIDAVQGPVGAFGILIAGEAAYRRHGPRCRPALLGSAIGAGRSLQLRRGRLPITWAFSCIRPLAEPRREYGFRERVPASGEYAVSPGLWGPDPPCTFSFGTAMEFGTSNLSNRHFADPAF